MASLIGMSVQGDGRPPDRGSFDKTTVDRWQVFGGMAGVAALLLSVVSGIKNLVPLSLIAAGVVTLVGVVLLYRWGRRPQRNVTRHFALPVLITVVGAATAGVLVGLEQRPAADVAQSGSSGSAPLTTTTAAALGEPTPATTSPAAGRTTTAPAEPTEGRFRAGQVRLNYEYSIDLDSTGENGGVTDKSSKQTDLTYEGGFRSPYMAIVAEKGEDAPPTHQDCTAATGLDDYIAGDKVVEGATFCVKTTEGRWAGLVVVDTESYSMVKFDLVVWATPGG